MAQLERPAPLLTVAPVVVEEPPSDGHLGAEALLRLDDAEATELEQALWGVRIRRVVAAMAVLARREVPSNLRTLLRRWGTEPVELASVILMAADRHDVDPLLLVAIAWRESRFRANAKGDHRDGRIRSCGMTQIRVDFPGRPSCDELMDVEAAVLWSAEHLAGARREDGTLVLARWNGRDYENRVWRDVDAMRTLAGESP